MKNLLILLLLAFSACAPVRIASTSQKPGVDFTAYKTYNFMDVSARNEASSEALGMGIGVQELKRAIAAELARRGYQPADRPDLWVNIGVVVEDQVQTRETNIRDAPRYIGQRNYHWQSEEVVVNTYKQGTATVELVDAARNERVWTGAAVGILTKDQERMGKRIDEAMQALFAKYPVKPR
ncbi:DUF4136 domain-containing protein [Hymenobacter sp. BT491]|uniref:DUF4136 domain-containing protein n=1 Tax=Hymenobacter sp. BT491 TaxID=2766779 RepID=UPI001653507C|nr:DUF4136 domain-containing protein [Hymenobacter sp. BT491]MBC6991913.1 DUF4136 domain-containing protein [Hymenobacter sp. BT491]